MHGSEYFARLASKPPLNRLHPRVGAFFRRHLEAEKAVEFRGQLVLNTHLPPWPSRAFDRMAAQMGAGGEAGRLFSVTVAVTNRCPFDCWHCYNAGRSQEELAGASWLRLAEELQELGAAVVTLTGGEPLLRDDLERIVRGFDDRSCVNLGTTGWGLSARRARALRDAGLFGVGISLDSDDGAEHDRLRRRPGAFREALRALRVCGEAGLYPYAVTVGRRELLARDRFLAFLELARDSGALEVHLLEPCATGKLAGDHDTPLTPGERRRILELQREVSRRDDLPILSSFTYLESAEAFGCGAGLTHLYVDGSGEVCPCNLVPLSFGNVERSSLASILDLMGQHFRRPRAACVGRVLGPALAGRPSPAPPETSCRICAEHLPGEHALPAFFEARLGAVEVAGQRELATAYDGVHLDYDASWVVEAGAAVRELAERLALRGDERVFEAGCGTGFGTALLAARLAGGGHVTAADLSEGMLGQARARLRAAGLDARFVHGDALAALAGERELDAVFTSWVLGYIPLAPFFAAAAKALRRGGKLGVVVHRENSPRREMELFAELVARDPSVMLRQVAFDFPRDAADLAERLTAAGFDRVQPWEGAAVFRYPSAEAVLEHLLRSGAGTVFHDAIDPARRAPLTAEFLELLSARNGAGGFEVRHEYAGAVARMGR